MLCGRPTTIRLFGPSTEPASGRLLHSNSLKDMKRILPLLVLAVSALVCHTANSATLISDQFVGYNTGNLGADSTTGTLNLWANSTPQVTLTNGSGSLDGTSLGLVASAGDKVFI